VGPDMHFHMVQVRNTFLEVHVPEDAERKSTRPRSKSWSGSSSNSCPENSSETAEKEQWHSVNVPGQATHRLFEENSSSSVSVDSETQSPSWQDFLQEFQVGLRGAEQQPKLPQPKPPQPKQSLPPAVRPQAARETREAEVDAAFQSQIEAIEELLEDDYQPQFGQSIGAKGHSRGKCTPCTRILIRPGCEYGARCMFCHLEHSHHMDSKKNRHRPCKAARQQYKQTIQKIYEEYKDDPERKKKALEKISETSPYMRSLLKGLGDDDEEEVLARVAQAAADEGVGPRVPGLQPSGSTSGSTPPVMATPKAKGGKQLISL